MAVAATNVFGPAVGAWEVRAAVVDTLKMWLPTYVHEFERRTGRAVGSVSPIRSWNETSERSVEAAQDPGDQMPGLLIVVPGTDGPLERRGDGSYAAWWAVVVHVIAAAKDKRAATEVAELYEAAIRLLLVQKASLGGFAHAIRDPQWAYDNAPDNLRDVAHVTSVAASFLTEDVVASGYGPKVPDDNTDLGLVQEVDIDALATRGDDSDAPDLMHLVERTAP